MVDFLTPLDEPVEPDYTSGKTKVDEQSMLYRAQIESLTVQLETLRATLLAETRVMDIIHVSGTRVGVQIHRPSAVSQRNADALCHELDNLKQRIQKSVEGHSDSTKEGHSDSTK